MSHPVLYEVNARCWLRELSEKGSARVTLANVPDSEFETWKRFGFSHIWLMGVWASGPLAGAEAVRLPQQRQSYSETLPDCAASDVAGSPYAIADYHVPAILGADHGLAVFRRKLKTYHLKLILDFVPNHLGLDHAWINEFPDLFLQADAVTGEGSFVRQTSQGVRTFAHGKDPNFPAWTDTIQVDYRRAETHAKMLEILMSIADRCDGVRCDMAMLVLPEIFSQTWSRFPNAPDATRSTSRAPQSGTSESFWCNAISSIKSNHPEFLFLAEAYWGLESRLQKEGFDFTYDKELYDRLVARDAAGVQRHLLNQAIASDEPATLPYAAHFLENHDERRIASILSPPEHRAAALIIMGLPGMRFLHEGQLTGARRRAPVQLTRRSQEPPIPEVVEIYEQLLTRLPLTAVGKGTFELLKPRAAWVQNPTAENIILVQWQVEPNSFELVAVNFAAHQGQCYVFLTIASLSGHDWRARDLLGGDNFIRNGPELQSRGLYLDLPAYAACLFHFERA